MIRRLLTRLGLRSRPPTPSRTSPAPSPRTAPARAAAPGPAGGPVELVLYKFDACPYCRRVQRHIEALGLVIEQRDTRQDPGAREALRALNGHTQVPCLLIDGQPLLESADIIDWLDAHSAELSGTDRSS